MIPFCKRGAVDLIVLHVLLLAIGISLTGCKHKQDAGLHLEYRMKVPAEYQNAPKNPQEGGTESVRYQKSYESFWWDCVMLKANKLDARCALACSGSKATVAGCRDGGVEADNQITALVNRYSPSEVRLYLRSLASSDEAKGKIYPAFPYKTPQPEKKQ